MQPTFIPWSGYFNLISQADQFVFLDDVQFEKQSWQSRNAILLDKKRFLLRLQISRGPLASKISEIELNQEPAWRERLSRTLRETYGKHPFKLAIEPVLRALSDLQLTSLRDFNIQIVEEYCDLLKITTPKSKSSEFRIEGNRSERILSICKRLACDEYLSPAGAKDYLEDDNLFPGSNVKLEFQDFNPKYYPQLGAKEFVSHLSIVDIMANIGPQATKEYIETGLYAEEHLTHEQNN